MTQKELDKILRKHKYWFKFEKISAMLRSIHLYWLAKIIVSPFELANLSYENLSYLDLSNRDLSFVKFRGCDLSFADLSHSNLALADLSDSILTQTDFSNSNLSYTKLNYTHLHNTSFYSANLKFVDFSGCEMKGFVYFGKANLHRVIGLPKQEYCPEEGEIIGYKNVDGQSIVKLLIPSDAKRVAKLYIKICSCDKAKVLAIENLDGSPSNKEQVVGDTNVVYKVGDTIYADNFDDNEYNDDSMLSKSAGIYFFTDRNDAKMMSIP